MQLSRTVGGDMPFRYPSRRDAVSALGGELGSSVERGGRMAGRKFFVEGFCIIIVMISRRCGGLDVSFFVEKLCIIIIIIISRGCRRRCVGRIATPRLRTE